MKIYKSLYVSLIFAAMLFSLSPAVMSQPEKPLKSDTIDILSYSVHLDIIHLSKKTISGYTVLTLVPRINNVSAVPLDLLKMTVDSVIAAGQPLSSFYYNDTLLRIPLPAAINPGDTITLKVCYHGKPVVDPSGWGGFYFSSDSAYAYNLGVGFQDVPHNYGRVWFPCIDDFTDRATFDCHIRVKNTKTAVCCGTLMSETDNGDGTKTFFWRLHNEIPSYLASVAVGSYVPVSSVFSSSAGNIPVKIYVPVSDTGHVKSSFVNLPEILSVYENAFGPYSWERVGYVGVPFTGGSMEHSTNIAYPLVCIDGSLSYESLYAHELSHQWFGDLVTCASAEDMWINEGWASWCESFFLEGLYGISDYKANVKLNHFNVLSKCHTVDAGYFALYGIPLNITYGSTVYDKGADVVHTLRYYLGDSLFFGCVKTLMNTYKYKDISTSELRDFITARTGINMNDFFDGWILSPGFPQFSIDSMKQQGTGNDYMVYVKQRLHKKPAFINSNKVEITFMSAAWQKYSESIDFSGQTGSRLFHLPFAPVAAFMDLEEKTGDATTDYYQVIKTTGVQSFSNSYFTLDVQNVSDSAFFRIEHSRVAPDPLKSPSPDIFRMSDCRYWKVDGIFPPGFNAKGRFSYSRSSNMLENVLLPTTGSADSLILLYRENAADDWHLVNFTKYGGSVGGYLATNNLLKGEYTFGVGKPFQSGLNDKGEIKKTPFLNIFPNPSNDTFKINFDAGSIKELKISDSKNNIVFNIKINADRESVTWKPSKLNSGAYNVRLYEKGKPVASAKAVYVR